MALSKASLKQKLKKELKSQGFVLDGEFAMAGQMAEAIANAVVDEINESGYILSNQISDEPLEGSSDLVKPSFE